MGLWDSFLDKMSGVPESKGDEEELSYIQQNPERVAIALDTVGTQLDPNNAFAGLGKMLGQGGLASKAASKSNWIEQLIKSLSPAGKEGPTKISITPGEQGGFMFNVSGESNKALGGPVQGVNTDLHKTLEGLNVKQ